MAYHSIETSNRYIILHTNPYVKEYLLRITPINYAPIDKSWLNGYRPVNVCVYYIHIYGMLLRSETYSVQTLVSTLSPNAAIYPYLSYKEKINIT